MEDAKNDKDKFTLASVKARLKAIKEDPESKEELDLLGVYIERSEQKSELDKKIKEAIKIFDKKVVEKYATLTVDEIKTLVIDDKWLASIEALTTSELDRISQVLTSRISSLAERYERTLPELEQEVQSLSGSVDLHLKKMGFVW